MKSLILVVLVGFLSGCGPKPDPKVAALEAKVAKLQDRVNALSNAMETAANVLDDHRGIFSNLFALSQNHEKSIDLLRTGVLDLYNSSKESAPDLTPDKSPGSARLVQPVEVSDPPLRVISAEVRPTEKNSSWWRMAYKLKIQSNRPIELTGRIRVKFLDASGFVLHDDDIYKAAFPARKITEFTGADLVNVSVAPRVVKVIAEIER